jgi:4-hydroxybenzoate polyprenyl transferase
MWEYIKLLRLDKPTGIFLLFWPCAWGLAIGSSVIDDAVIFYKYLLLFFLGSFFMRSAGCVYNDIVDRKIDAKVSRTKSRPIAKGTISVTTGWMIILLLIFFSILILIQFNLNSIIFGLSSGLLVTAYPFMKRITYWPQLFLGITFNWGVVLAWLVLENKISLTPLVLYSSAIFWTLGYDTIYGMQDIKDDLKIGVKSTSIKFKKKIKTFLLICYSISTSLLLLSLALLDANFIFFIMSMLSSCILFAQVLKYEEENTEKNSKLFALNNYYGLSIFLTLMLTIRHG